LARKGGSGVSHLTAAFRSDGIDRWSSWSLLN
jgi:hypothetical protein